MYSVLTFGERVARVVGTRHVVVDAVDDRAEAGLGVVGLALLAELEVQEVLGGRRGVRGQRGRVLDQQGVVGEDVVDVVTGGPGLDRVVLVGEQDVAVAGDERRQGVATAARQGDGVVRGAW